MRPAAKTLRPETEALSVEPEALGHKRQALMPYQNAMAEKEGKMTFFVMGPLANLVKVA